MYLYIILVLIILLANKFGPYQNINNKIVRKGREEEEELNMFGKEGFFFGTRGTFQVHSEDVKNNIGHADASGNIADPSFWAIFNIGFTIASNVAHFVIKVPYDFIMSIANIVMDTLRWCMEMLAGGMDIVLIGVMAMSKVFIKVMKKIFNGIIDLFAMVRHLPAKLKAFSNSL
jgi:hypothetical protein